MIYWVIYDFTQLKLPNQITTIIANIKVYWVNKEEKISNSNEF